MLYLGNIDKLHEAVTILISVWDVTGTSLDQNISYPEMFRYFPQSHNGQYLKLGLGLFFACHCNSLPTNDLIARLRAIKFCSDFMKIKMSPIRIKDQTKT